MEQTCGTGGKIRALTRLRVQRNTMGPIGVCIHRESLALARCQKSSFWLRVDWLKSATVIPKFDEVPDVSQECQNQSQGLGKIGATSAARCLARVEYRGGQYLAHKYRLIVGWRCPILESRLPPTSCPLWKM
jgi:hypothetical protein